LGNLYPLRVHKGLFDREAVFFLESFVGRDRVAVDMSSCLIYPLFQEGKNFRPEAGINYLEMMFLSYDR
ncbi:MAG: hypothetical protein ACYCQJ_13940, partial [Nitrososphaerales archaeon]